MSALTALIFAVALSGNDFVDRPADEERASPPGHGTPRPDPPDPLDDPAAFVRTLTNRSVHLEVPDFLGPRLHFGLPSLPNENRREREMFRRLRALPPDELERLTADLRAMLEDRDRFVAAHVVLWILYGPPGRPIADGLRLLQGLHVNHWRPWHDDFNPEGRQDGVDLGTRGDALLFIDPEAQRARLPRWWDEYFRGERTVFFQPGEDRPRRPTRVDEDPERRRTRARVYDRFLPPRPAEFGAMSVRELEAYYGAPPDVPADFDPEAAPPDFAPPPVPDWRRRAGLPPADAAGP